jgi:hypothetical protein
VLKVLVEQTQRAVQLVVAQLVQLLSDSRPPAPRPTAAVAKEASHA